MAIWRSSDKAWMKTVQSFRSILTKTFPQSLLAPRLRAQILWLWLACQEPQTPVGTTDHTVVWSAYIWIYSSCCKPLWEQTLAHKLILREVSSRSYRLKHQHISHGYCMTDSTPGFIVGIYVNTDPLATGGTRICIEPCIDVHGSKFIARQK